MNNNIVFPSSQSDVNSFQSRPENPGFNSLNALHSETPLTSNLKNQDNLHPSNPKLATLQSNSEENLKAQALRSRVEFFNKINQEAVMPSQEDKGILPVKIPPSSFGKEKLGSQECQFELLTFEKKASSDCSEAHPLEDLLEDQDVLGILRSYDEFILRHSFKAELDQETQKHSPTLYSLEIAAAIQDFNFWLQPNSYSLRSVKELSLSLESQSEGSALRPEPRQLELRLESLTVNILNKILEHVEFEALVDFVGIQRSLKTLNVSFRADNASDQQMKLFSEGLRELKKLNKAKFEFINCHLLKEDDLRVLVEELAKIESLKSAEIFVGGCPNVTQALEFREHIQMKFKPEFKE